MIDDRLIEPRVREMDTVDRTELDELARFRLDGKVAMVMGGYGGIGQRLCDAFAAVGARVVVGGRDRDRAEAVCERIRDRGGEAISAVCDATSKQDTDRAVDDALEAFGRLDAMVAAVGGGAGGALHPAESYPESAWDEILDLNLRSALFSSQAAARAMIAGGEGGRIVHVSSVRGRLGIDNGFSAYVASKGALEALTRQQATEWGKHGITVNAISPTFVRTEQAASLLADDEFREGLYARIPLGRIAETDDVVGPALLLCSEASAFISGVTLMLDGGLTACQ
jgi:NAD(P)-dependent dehydrogenase (short-subunit alcohol dehydrogenase family)